MSLSTDLLHIRTLQGLSIEDVHQITKLPVDIIKSIENGNIFKDGNKNVTYQRSFIRSLSKALKISEEHIVQALDSHYNDAYSDFLLREYGDPSKVEKEIVQKKDPKRIFPAEKVDSKSKSKSTPNSQTKQTLADVKPIDDAVKLSSVKNFEEDLEDKYSSYPDMPPQPTQSDYNKTQAPPTIHSVNWADVGKKNLSFGNKSGAVLAVAILVLIVAVGSWYLIGDSSSESADNLMNPDKTEFVSDQQSNSDESNADTPTDTIVVAPANVKLPKPVALSLSDTLSIVIFAVQDKLEPVRVKTDLSGSYFPYWVEQGQAMRFQFRDSVSIRGQYNRMAVLFNGHVVQEINNHRGPNREIILTRSLFLKDPKWLSEPTDPADLKTKPDSILDRPVFN